MDRRRLARAIAARYRGPWLRGYARGKLRTDPVYEAVAQHLRGGTAPVLDVGCGIGLAGQYLRRRGYAGPILGIDPDAGKIEAAKEAAADVPDLRFEARDGTEPPEDGDHSTRMPGHVLLLDVLHYFPADQQAPLLRRLSERVGPGGWFLIRATPRDASWRFRFTRWEERFARTIRWMKRPAVCFPAAASVLEALRAAGLEGDARPLWGRTPFNSYLFAARRPEEA